MVQHIEGNLIVKRTQILPAVAVLALLLAGCSPAQPAPSPAGTQAEHEAEQARQREAKRVESVKAELNRVADMYDYDAAIKLVKDDPNEQLSSMVDGLQEEKAATSAWPEPGKIPHLSFHSLVIDPQRAFDGDSRARGYEDYMITRGEFAAILNELYKRDYVLVNPADFARPDKKDRMRYRDIMLPEGKKPIVLSADDVNFHEYMAEDGFAEKLLLTGKGQVRSLYVDAKGKEHVGAYSVSTMVDDFVKEHPEFSYRGAKGILAVTGHNGVFGHHTSPSVHPGGKQLKQETRAATEIAKTLKADGWVFAANSWGQVPTGTASLARLQRDFTLWEKEVQPIVGDTEHLVFPFGSDIASTGRYYGARYELLRDFGFRYFYGIDGTTTSWTQQTDQYQRQMSINVSGLQFARDQDGQRPVLDRFFDVADITDKAR